MVVSENIENLNYIKEIPLNHILCIYNYVFTMYLQYSAEIPRNSIVG